MFLKIPHQNEQTLIEKVRNSPRNLLCSNPSHQSGGDRDCSSLPETRILPVGCKLDVLTNTLSG